MAKTQIVETITVQASADLSASQFLLGKINAGGQVALVAVAGDRVDGVIANKPTAAGQACELQVGGMPKCIAGGVIVPGSEVAAAATGKAVAANTGDYVFGIYTGLVNAANNDMIPVLVDKYVSTGGGKLDGADMATLANGAISPAVLTPGVVEIIALDIPDAATTTYSYVNFEKIEILDVQVIKDTAGAGNTIQLKTGGGTAISDAIAAAVDKTSTRAGTMDKAQRTIAAAAGFQITATRAAGSMAAQVYLYCIKRP